MKNSEFLNILVTTGKYDLEGADISSIANKIDASDISLKDIYDKYNNCGFGINTCIKYIIRLMKRYCEKEEVLYFMESASFICELFKNKHSKEIIIELGDNLLSIDYCNVVYNPSIHGSRIYFNNQECKLIGNATGTYLEVNGVMYHEKLLCIERDFNTNKNKIMFRRGMHDIDKVGLTEEAGKAKLMFINGMH